MGKITILTKNWQFQQRALAELVDSQFPVIGDYWDAQQS